MVNRNPTALYFSDKLKEKLDSIMCYPFTFVEAPMGYGKTTAIRTALKSANCTVLWQSVFDAGSDYFWPDFCDAFLPLSPELAISLRQIGLPDDIVLIRQAIELIKKVRLPGETVLVIDDYHFVNSADVDSFFSYLIPNVPEMLHIIILSRTAFLKTAVAEMRAKGAVNYINADALKLGPEDVEKYCALYGVAMSRDEQERLYKYSEGWITPLYLLVREYAQTGQFIATDEIGTLVYNAVYKPLSDEVKEFLSRVCVFDSFTLRQAVHMWQRDNAEELLEELMHGNVFISKATSGAYSFHNLFKSHIQAAFDVLPESERTDIWKHAGEYFLNDGNTMASMDCFEKSGNSVMMLLEALASRNGADLTNAHRKKLIECLDRCPDVALTQNLTAVLVFIRFMISYNERDRLGRCISAFENSIGDFTGAEKNMLIMNYERFLSLTKYNDIAEMSVHHRKALTYMDRPFTGEERVGNWTFGSPSVLLMFYRESGKLSEVLEQMRECMPIYYRLTDGHGYGAEYVMEAEAAYNAGDFTKAETIIHKAQYYAREKNQWSILLTAEFLRMRLSLVRGDWFEVSNIQKQMSDIIAINRQHLLRHTFDICQSYISLLLDMPDNVMDWIVDSDFTKTHLMFPALPALHIAYGRYLLVKGEYAKLCGSAEVARQTSSVYPNLLGVIYADIYLAAALYAMSKKDEALSCLESALDAALPDRILMPFVENTGYMRDMLVRLAAEERYADGIARIFELHKGFEQIRRKIVREHFPGQIGGLSERELEVARLAAKGLSNLAIATLLYLSEDGVKKRLKAVYTKLSISSRKQLKDIFASDNKNGYS